MYDPKTLYVADIGSSHSLSVRCYQNENVPNYSFLEIGSAGAAGMHNHKHFDDYDCIKRESNLKAE